MEPSLGDEPKNEKALVYFESFLATGATGFLYSPGRTFSSGHPVQNRIIFLYV